MRHRRRLNTQTIQRKKTTQTQRRPAPKEPNHFISFLKFLIIVGLIVLATYAGYKYLFPIVQQKLPSIHLPSGKKQAKVETVQKPALPVEQKKELPVPKPEIKSKPDVYVKATQVEILNGCGQQGAAKILADKLSELKYDVVNTGNYLKGSKPYFKVKKSRIINQINTKKSRKKCKELAKALGISEKQIQSFSNPNPIADITLIIGQDYKSLSIFKRKK